jgi:L-rhamnonate dehydratase
VAASLHWLSTCRDAFLFEDCVEDSPLRHDLTQEKMQADGGWITIPDRPGQGVTLDEDFVAALSAVERSALSARLASKRP